MNRILACVLCLICSASWALVAEEGKIPAAPVNPAPVAAQTGDAVKAQAGCSHCTFGATSQCMPAIKIGDTVYIVKVNEQASEATKKFVASLPQMKGDAKPVKIIGKPLSVEEGTKAAAVAKSETKSYYEIGEMSLQE